MHLIAVVLRNSEHPVLSRPQMYRVAKSWEKYREYIKYKKELDDSDDDEGPKDEEAWLFEDLQLLGKLYSRLRDREQLISLIFEVRRFPIPLLPWFTMHSMLGKHRRFVERHHHDILLPTCPGVQGGEHRRLFRRPSGFHERYDQDSRTDGRTCVRSRSREFLLANAAQ